MQHVRSEKKLQKKLVKQMQEKHLASEPNGPRKMNADLVDSRKEANRSLFLTRLPKERKRTKHRYNGTEKNDYGTLKVLQN